MIHNDIVQRLWSPAPSASGRLTSSVPFFRKASSAIAEQERAAVREWEKRASALGLRSAEIDVMRGVIDPER